MRLVAGADRGGGRERKAGGAESRGGPPFRFCGPE